MVDGCYFVLGFKEITKKEFLNALCQEVPTAIKDIDSYIYLNLSGSSVEKIDVSVSFNQRQRHYQHMKAKKKFTEEYGNMMGQSYKAVLTKNNKPLAVVLPEDFNVSSNLMDHAYLGNYFVRSVLGTIQNNNIMCVTWLKEHSNFTQIKNKVDFTEETFMSIYNWAWDLKPLYIQGYLVDDTVGFLVNHTKGTYIDMRKVFNKEVLIFDNAGNFQAINPLPFLTSVGNSNNSDIKDRELIGTWAFDIIGYYEELPNKDLKEFIGLSLSNTSYKL